MTASSVRLNEHGLEAHRKFSELTQRLALRPEALAFFSDRMRLGLPFMKVVLSDGVVTDFEFPFWMENLLSRLRRADRPLCESKAISFAEASEELGTIILRDDVPSEIRSSVRRMLDVLPKCLMVVPEIDGAVIALDDGPLLQPSDLFVRYVSACRTKDWEEVFVIEHEATHGRRDTSHALFQERDVKHA